MQPIDYHAILPELIVSGTLMLVLIVDTFLKPKRAFLTMWVGFVGVIAALIAALRISLTSRREVSASKKFLMTCSSKKGSSTDFTDHSERVEERHC